MSENGNFSAPSPLYRDPIYDCPTDPVVVWNHAEKKWYLFYTQRRSGGVEIGVSWVHGTKIGVASSADGLKWLYRGTLELEIEPGHNTFWAPEIIYELGEYHMYVSYITGIPSDWEEPRKMLHYTSDTIWDWEYQGEIPLASNRVIDACIYKMEDGYYKMWYKDEENHSKTSAAVSKDLYHFDVLGAEIEDCSQEGPNVFELSGKKWLIADYWKGLAVYSSSDFTNWKRCEDILNQTGTRNMDRGYGHHADVVVVNERAYLFYFCHPYAEEMNEQTTELTNTELSNTEFPNKEGNKNTAVIQVAELIVREDRIICERNQEVSLVLNGYN